MDPYEIADGDVLFREVMGELSSLEPQDKIKTLRRRIIQHTSEHKENASLLHSLMRAWTDIDGESLQSFFRSFLHGEFLMQTYDSAHAALLADRAVIFTIKQRWPEWDWTLPDAKTPDRWSTRLLNDLRYIALRLDDWEAVMTCLAWHVDRRCDDRRGRQGVSRTRKLMPMDCRSFLERTNDMGRPSLWSLDLSNATEQESSEMSPEQARRQSQGLRDVSSLVGGDWRSGRTSGVSAVEAGDESVESAEWRIEEEEAAATPEPARKKTRRTQPTQNTLLRDLERVADGLRRAEREAHQALLSAPSTTPAELENLVRLMRNHENARRNRRLHDDFRAQANFDGLI
ncbi:hypothetical protein AC578_9954 [Pseudocercospora eumusae]|uniref:Uncharacterized protein n=1 Tax=Pseudocercospora eumusae TaxID=321146 RepID=A0A139H0F8_9PEZI|nr:hypothetical protein AC578_9954 [Pseudocercospora eumusae]